MRKVFVVGGDRLVERMFRENFTVELIDNIIEADIVVFTGGEDVSADWYGHAHHPTTYCNPVRDYEETAIWDHLHTDQLKVGICRGSQFLCVMNGGTLYQDVDRHAIHGTHNMIYWDTKGQGHTHEVTSTHHQMQNPYISQDGNDLTFELWGSAGRCTYRDQSEIERAALGDNAHPDVEIVFWPKTNTLGFQPHPEYDSESTLELFRICLNRALERMN